MIILIFLINIIFFLAHDIVKELCPEEKYAKNSHCYVCKKKFNAIKLTKKRWFID